MPVQLQPKSDIGYVVADAGDHPLTVMNYVTDSCQVVVIAEIDVTVSCLFTHSRVTVDELCYR